jgi:hypothetical protein
MTHEEDMAFVATVEQCDVHTILDRDIVTIMSRMVHIKSQIAWETCRVASMLFIGDILDARFSYADESMLNSYKLFIGISGVRKSAFLGAFKSMLPDFGLDTNRVFGILNADASTINAIWKRLAEFSKVEICVDEFDGILRTICGQGKNSNSPMTWTSVFNSLFSEYVAWNAGGAVTQEYGEITSPRISQSLCVQDSTLQALYDPIVMNAGYFNRMFFIRIPRGKYLPLINDEVKLWKDSAARIQMYMAMLSSLKIRCVIPDSLRDYISAIDGMTPDDDLGKMTRVQTYVVKMTVLDAIMRHLMTHECHWNDEIVVNVDTSKIDTIKLMCESSFAASSLLTSEDNELRDVKRIENLLAREKHVQSSAAYRSSHLNKEPFDEALETVKARHVERVGWFTVRGIKSLCIEGEHCETCDKVDECEFEYGGGE